MSAGNILKLVTSIMMKVQGFQQLLKFSYGVAEGEEEVKVLGALKQSSIVKDQYPVNLNKICFLQDLEKYYIKVCN